jgi:hypothetical protein
MERIGLIHQRSKAARVKNDGLFLLTHLLRRGTYRCFVTSPWDL